MCYLEVCLVCQVTVLYQMSLSKDKFQLVKDKSGDVNFADNCRLIEALL